jgi:hypothetical protein
MIIPKRYLLGLKCMTRFATSFKTLKKAMNTNEWKNFKHLYKIEAQKFNKTWKTVKIYS